MSIDEPTLILRGRLGMRKKRSSGISRFEKEISYRISLTLNSISFFAETLSSILRTRLKNNFTLDLWNHSNRGVISSWAVQSEFTIIETWG